MSVAVLFPGQGSQVVGMGLRLYESHPQVAELFERAENITGLPLRQYMFEGPSEALQKTSVTQPALYLHGYAVAKVRQIEAQAVAGHSLGEFTALAVAGVFSFEEGLELVKVRASGMQAACDERPSTMAAIIGLEDEVVESLCEEVSSFGMVVPANYNSPGQLVVSGEIAAVEALMERAKKAGAKLAKKLPVNGAFHSPLMESARHRLAEAIQATTFCRPRFPVYPNVTASPETDPLKLKELLIQQLTAPVRWTQTLRQMWADGIRTFYELGPGNVLSGLVRRTLPEATSFSYDS
ncbi:MAG: ACP S-malonyltransferase [Bacteroidia bacterium]|nr:ACP S-malonyltransferase [Bacteroidia bacterium]MCX7652172.1 ACP S-malonyltransferase [Bacteroidia bacterium]MDW8416434.1 ACP S-malonyltransferase [Bacteroidia bacterium]